MKAEAVNKKTGKELLKIDVKKKENQLANESIVLGAKSEKVLRKLPYEEKRQQAKMEDFFIVVICCLQKKLPLGDKLLISAACLHPENRKNEYPLKNIKYLAKCFPHFVQQKEVSIVTDEWKLYQVESE